MKRLAALLAVAAACHPPPAPPRPQPPRARAPTQDIDGDGRPDRIERGQVELAHSAGDAPVMVLTPDGRFPSFGASAIVGDVDGDDLADVMLGDPGCPDSYREMPICDTGRAYLFRGARTGMVATPAQTLVAGAPATMFGATLIALGDVDGDGRDDVALPDHAGVHVFLGAAGGLSPVPIDLAPPPQDGAPATAAAAGDVDGDGRAEVVAIRPKEATVFLGGMRGPDPAHTITLAPPEHMAFLGSAVAGDFDGDGFSDLAFGATLLGATVDPAVVIFAGGAGGPSASTTVWGQRDVDFGAALQVVDNPDGPDDLVIVLACAIRDHETGACIEPRGALYLGSPTGLEKEPDELLLPGRY